MSCCSHPNEPQTSTTRSSAVWTSRCKIIQAVCLTTHNIAFLRLSFLCGDWFLCAFFKTSSGFALLTRFSFVTLSVFCSSLICYYIRYRVPILDTKTDNISVLSCVLYNSRLYCSLCAISAMILCSICETIIVFVKNERFH